MSDESLEMFIRYAIGLSLVVALIALWRVRKRGRDGLWLVGGAVGFAVLLYSYLHGLATTWLYAMGFGVVACLVMDAMVRPKPGGKR